MRRRVRFRSLAAIVTSSVMAAGMLVSGCSNKDARVSPTFSQEEGELGPRNQFGASVSTGGRLAERLETASRLTGSGKFDEAAEIYEEVYAERSADPEERAAALFGLARVQSDILNPHKDFEAARETLNTLLREFPGSSLRDAAESRLASLAG